MTRKIERTSGTPTGPTGRIGGAEGAVPMNISPLLRRFWRFAQDMAKRFSKNLLKNRDEDFLRVVRTKFDDEVRK